MVGPSWFLVSSLFGSSYPVLSVVLKVALGSALGARIQLRSIIIDEAVHLVMEAASLTSESGCRF